MIKKLATVVALSVSLATVQPVWGQEHKKYDSLTVAQKELLQGRAITVADPSFAGAVFYGQFVDTAKETEPGLDARWYHTFGECASEMLVQYYLDLKPLEVMYWTDTEIEAHVGNYSFDIGALCAYEAWEDKKNTRRL